MPKKKKTLTALRKEADKYCSLYVRKSNASFQDYVSCYTCGKTDKWNSGKMHCGHFFSRIHLNTRYDLNNLRVQCVGCNVMRSGNYPEFAVRLIKEKGIDFLFELYEKHKIKKRFTREDYEEVIEKYKFKLDV